MKRFFAACLALIMLLSAGEFAFASEIDEIIKLDCEPVRYLIYYRDLFVSSHWSLVDADGGMIKEFFAEEIYQIDDGRYVVRRSGLYDFMDASGEFISEPCYQYVGSFSEGLAPVKYEGFYGYVNGDFEIVIPPAFDRADRFYNGLACVGVNGLYGFIDAEGKYVFEPQFDSFGGVYNASDVIHVTKGNSDLLINKDGTVMLETDYSIDNYYETEAGYDAVIYEKTGGGKLYGLLLAEGSVIEPRFLDVKYSSESPLIAVKQKAISDDPWADELWGLINRAGEYVMEPTLNGFRFEDGGLALGSTGGLWGLLDKNGEWLIEPRFEQCSFGWPKLVTVDGLYGMLNADGSYMLEPAFEKFYSFKNGYAEAGQNGLYGLVDESGSWVVPAQYAVIGDRNAHCTVVSMDEDAAWWDVYDRAPGAGLVSLPEGKLLLELGYDNISIANDDGTVSAEKDGVTRVYKLEDGELREISVVDSSLDLSVYLPNEGEKVARLDGEAHIQWQSDSPLPRLDGATALLPVYAAFAEATYPDTLRYATEDVDEALELDVWPAEEPLFTCTKTIRAYERLTDGEADIIFCAGPSEEEALRAKLMGAEFELTPIGYEAFVFIVNRDNPVDGLTLDEIRGIYSGRITSWAEMGHVELGDIIAYQRPKYSGSQTALEKLMGGEKLMKAPGQVVDSMMGIVDNIAYRNLENSIGYSFRFFVSGMMESDVKLLAIDGVEPSEENIRNGTYPLITTLYAVTRKGESNPNVKVFLEWMTTPEAQALLEQSGYVGLGR